MHFKRTSMILVGILVFFLFFSLPALAGREIRVTIKGDDAAPDLIENVPALKDFELQKDQGIYIGWLKGPVDEKSLDELKKLRPLYGQLRKVMWIELDMYSAYYQTFVNAGEPFHFEWGMGKGKGIAAFTLRGYYKAHIYEENRANDGTLYRMIVVCVPETVLEQFREVMRSGGHWRRVIDFSAKE